MNSKAVSAKALIALLALIGNIFFAPPIAYAAQGRSGRPRRTEKIKPARTLQQLQNEIRTLLDKPEFAVASVGIKIATLEGGKTIYEQDADKLLVPASNMKLYTTAAALEKLGSNYKIRTSVYAPSRPNSSGKISGDLRLYGRGDPSLASRFYNGDTPMQFDALAAQLASAGVKRVDGDLIADESYFKGTPLGNGWEWMDIQWYFGAEISALSANDNCIKVTVRPGEKRGDPASAAIEPDIGFVKIINKAETDALRSRQDIGMSRGLSDNELLIWGKIPLKDSGFQARISIHRPAAMAAALFKDSLNRAGITVSGQIKVADSSLASQSKPLDLEKDISVELAFVESPPLSELVRVINKFSNNQYAESLLRVVGKEAGKRDLDSDEAGIEIIKEILKKAGADVKYLEMHDGSGLSRRTLVNASSITRLLVYMGKSAIADFYRSSLPIGAVDGSLVRRMAGTTAANNVMAKTGTLSNTSSLSGYITTEAGEELVFSIIVNHFTGELGKAIAAQNGICALLASFPERIEKAR